MSIAITAYENTPYQIDVNSLINDGSDGRWLITANLIHNNNLGSYVYKSIPELIEGHTYRVTYNIDSLNSCTIQCFLGDTPGAVQIDPILVVENIVFLGVNKRISFYSTSTTATITSYLIEELVTTIVDTPLLPNDLQNNSWTLSFNPILNQWISFHSYIPNNYLIHPDKMLTKRNDTQLKLVNSGNFGSFFDEDVKPFIIETITNEYKTDTKVFDSITVIMDTSNDNLFTNTFFDNGIIYTENQCSGIITFNIGINVTKKEKNWNFNNFLDITNNTSNTIFVSDWDNVKLFYPIDKIVNVNKIDTSKPWYQRGRMRDKYMAIRLSDTNTSGTKFTLKFISSTFRTSQR